MKIDFQTLAITLIILNSLQTTALIIQARLMRFTPKLDRWGAGNVCFILGLALHVFTSNNTVSRVSADAALILGSALIYLGTQNILGLPHPWGRRSFQLTILSSWAALGVIEANAPASSLSQAILTGTIALCSGLTARLLYFYRQQFLLIPALFLGSIFLIATFACSGMAMLAILDLVNDRWIQLSFLQLATDFQLLITSTLWTFGLILTVNQQAIAVSKEEQTTTEQIFDVSPDAILITQLSDGLIVRVNQSFLELIDQPKENVIGRSILDLNFWKNQHDRSRMIDCLLSQGSCEDLEVGLQRPDQSNFIGQVTAKLIKINSKFHIISTIHDVTQRRKSEDLLRQSEERLELAFQGSLAAIWDWDLVTSDLYFSSRSLEILGYQEGDIPPKISSFFNLLHPDDRIFVQSALDAHFSSAKYPYDVEYRIQQKSGEYRWFQSTGIAVRDEQNKPYRMVGSTIDITRRKQAEEALRESEQNYRTVVNSGHVLIWLADKNGDHYYFNSVWLNFTGRSLEQELDSGSIEGVLFADLQSYLSTYRTAFSQHNSYKAEYRLRRHDGEYRWILEEGSPRYDTHGNFIGYIGHCLDIHDRKIAETALYREQEFTRILLDSLSDGVVACDAEGNLVLFNQVARSWHSYLPPRSSASEWSALYNIYQPNGSDLMPTDALPLFRAFRHEIVQDVEMMIKDPSKSERWVVCSGGPFFDDQNQFLGAVIAMRDVTAERKTKQQLQEALVEAQRLRAALDQVSSHIYMKDLQFRYIYANRSALDFVDRSLEEILGKDDFFFFSEEAAKLLQAIDSRVFQGEQTTEEIHLVNPKDGQLRVYLEIKTPIYESAQSNNIIGLLGISTDITEQKKLEQKLQQQATTDALTGILNRRQFITLAQAELNRIYRIQRDTSLSLVIIDIDHFKTINDSYGHTVGDQVLILWTNICQQNIREVDIFARLGGDEFVLMLPETNGKQAYQVMDRIRQLVIQQSLHLPQQAIAITISVGIAVWTPEILTLDQFLERADRALYQAKQQGRDRIILLDTSSEEIIE
ncbi:sensor domain-containing diguanylate cyclase [Synechococcus elongatus]|uniref:sensor domain-containing diguanylate cyclase n=1 Tax=Synechococcus elongatus TaxID=32046 RepID=UPI000F7FA1DE|nr:PAS domain S-box protein [Synechococcus elongatus]